MPPVSKIAKGVASFADAAALKRSKDAERRAMHDQLRTIDEQMMGMQNLQKKGNQYIDFENRRSPELPDLLRDKQAEWFFGAEGDTTGVFAQLQSRFNLHPDFKAHDLDDYLEALSRASKRQDKYTSLEAQKAEIQEILKNFSAATGIPPAVLAAELGIDAEISTPVGHIDDELGRIRDEHNLGTEGMVSSYLTPESKPYQHQSSRSQTFNPEDAFITGDAIKHGLAEIPIGYTELAADLAPYSLPGRIYEMVTNKPSDAPIAKHADRVREYWQGDLEKPDRPWQHVVSGIASLLF